MQRIRTPPFVSESHHMPDSGSANPVVTVRLVYLARLREALGCAGETLALLPGERTVTDVLHRLRARADEWAVELAPRRALRVAVNHALASPDTELRDGDEVALLPPVTGG
jgi:molybdopterin synthase sulfur carrier subunit